MARMSRLLRFWTQNPVVPPSLVERKRSRDVPFRSALSSASVHTCVYSTREGGGGQRRRRWCVVREGGGGVWSERYGPLMHTLYADSHVRPISTLNLCTTQTAEEIASQ